MNKGYIIASHKENVLKLQRTAYHIIKTQKKKCSQNKILNDHDHGLVWVPYSEINHFHASVDRHGILSLIWNLWDVLVKTLGTGPTLPSPIQDPQIVMLHRCNAKRAPTKCCFVALQVQMCDCRMPTHTLLFRLVVNIGTAKKSVSLSGWTEEPR